MGWTELLDENDVKIGVVGDEAWDAAGVALWKLFIELEQIYRTNFARPVTYDEFESVVEFALGGIVR